MPPYLVLDPRKHCSCFRRIDARPTFGVRFSAHSRIKSTLLTQFFLTKKYSLALKTCCSTNVGSWIEVESKAIRNMIIISTELLSINHVVDSTNLQSFAKVSNHLQFFRKYLFMKIKHRLNNFTPHQTFKTANKNITEYTKQS